MKSQWRKWITQPGNIRVVALDGTELVRELCVQQKLDHEAWPGLGEAVVGALLIASAHKSNESINLNAKGSGLYRQSIIDASPEGKVRGFLLTNQQAPPTLGTGPWGTGVLSILYTKNFEGKHPYTGMVAISDGALDSAINAYYRDSEQLVSRVSLRVHRDADNRVIARGVLVQAMGGADEVELDRIRNLTEDHLSELADLAEQPDRLAARAAEHLSARLEEIESTPLQTFCTCSVERIERALTLTGEADTTEALGQDAYLEITCDFCRREYKISAERIRELFSRDPSRLQSLPARAR